MGKRRGRFCFGLGIENDRWVGSDRVYSVSETLKMKKVRRMPNLENLVEPRIICSNPTIAANGREIKVSHNWFCIITLISSK